MNASHIAYKAAEWLNPFVHAMGLVVCLWAYRFSRKPAYFVIGFYYLLAVGSLLFGPMINRAITERSQTQTRLSAEVEQQYQEEIRAVHEKYYSRPGDSTVSTVAKAHDMEIGFPVGPLILLSGIWMLAKEDYKKFHVTKGPPVA